MAEILMWADEGDDDDDKFRIIIDNSAPDFYIQNYKNGSSWENSLRLIADGAAEIFHDGVKKFDTVAGGTRIFGYLSMQGTGGHIYLPDEAELKIGNGEDLKIYHNGANKIVSNNSMTTYIGGDQLQITNAGITTCTAKFFADGACELNYNNVKKLETIATGVNVTGGIRLGGNNAANECDDYEEGTWTPTATAGTFTTGTGTYTKVGRLVTAYFVIEVHSTTSGNNMQFNGLPFTNAGNAGENMGSIAYNETGNVMRIYVNDGVAGLFWNDSTSFFTYANCSGDRIRGGVSYFA